MHLFHKHAYFCGNGCSANILMISSLSLFTQSTPLPGCAGGWFGLVFAGLLFFLFTPYPFSFMRTRLCNARSQTLASAVPAALPGQMRSAAGWWLTALLLAAVSSSGWAQCFQPTLDPTTYAEYIAGTTPNSVAVGDFNGDARPDLAVANYTSNTVSVLLGNGTGGFGAKTDFAVGTNPYSVAVGDFNGDARPDLAVANHSSNTVSVLLGNGAGGFGAKTDFAVGSFPYSVAVGDFNGDARPDLAVANLSSNRSRCCWAMVRGALGPKPTLRWAMVPFR